MEHSARRPRPLVAAAFICALFPSSAVLRAGLGLRLLVVVVAVALIALRDPALGRSSGAPPAPPSRSSDATGRMPVRVVGGRLVVRCDVSTQFRRIPANLFVEFERPCGLELHNRAADGIGVDRRGGVPITLHIPGLEVTVARRGHGDEDTFERFTRLYSRELGEVALIGAIGSELLDDYHVTLDVAHGLISLAPPRAGGDSPPPAAGVQVVGVTLANGRVWMPVRLPEGELGVVALGSSRYDSVIDRGLCDRLGHPAGDIGPLMLKEFDISAEVALRPVELVEVHADGAIGTTGINLLERWRFEVDHVGRRVLVSRAAERAFPAADRSAFRAFASEEAAPLQEYLEAHPKSRLAREAAERLLELRLDEDASSEELRVALDWIARTRIGDLQATEALATMETLLAARRPDLAITVGEQGLEHGREDRYPEALPRLHQRIGELLLDAGDLQKAWEHLLSAAFGLPDDGLVNLQLGRCYEQQGRLRRAMSRYVQAVIAPETGPQAVAGLERVQRRLGGEPLSVDLVDRMISGKVRSFSAATHFEPTPETDTGRCVLAEFFTNPHLGRKRGEEWVSFELGGAMAVEGLLSHFPRERLVVLTHFLPDPEPNALVNDYAMRRGAVVGGDPSVILVDGVQTGPGAGRWRDAEAIFQEDRRLVVEALRRPTPYRIEGRYDVDDGVVSGTCTVRGPAAESAVVVPLLAERGVLYPGKGKVVVHRWVARGPLSGGTVGVPLQVADDGTMRLEFRRSLADITAQNVAELERREAAGSASATRLSVEIDPRQVEVVVILRSTSSGEVLQCASLTRAGGDAGTSPTVGEKRR